MEQAKQSAVASTPTASTPVATKSILVLGFGNPAREDDGIGLAIVEGIKNQDVTVESNYQLTVEDSSTIAEHDVVIFVDASIDSAEPFAFCRVQPRRNESFSTHSILPPDVLGMAHDMFGSKAEGYMLSVRGYSFRMFTEEMSASARANVDDAVRFLETILQTKELQKAAGGNQ